MKGMASVCLVALASLTLADSDPRFPNTGKEWTLESLVNPEELGDYFEGDIELPLPKMNKNGIIDEKFRWPGGRVAYVFDSKFSKENKEKVRRGMDSYKSITANCITFHERTNETDYILFTNDDLDGCHSRIGRKGGMQIINYPYWCLSKYGSILHEMLHALGFYHEQSRTDRDHYVTIMWNNIQEKRRGNFKKYPSSVVSGFNETYDYGSVLHYSAYAFTANGKKTIVTKVPNAVIGQRKDLSEVDLRKLVKMYKC